jgi:GNAT superfamily N-acetyltransferase
MHIRKLTLNEMEQAAVIHRTSFDNQLPWLAGLHTAEEDTWFYKEKMFKQCQVFGAVEADSIIGVIAFTPDTIEQLYVLPKAQGRGIGSKLLAIAQANASHLKLWTFQKNTQARQFYEAKGFVALKQTDGSGNEEKEPDILYAWSNPELAHPQSS